MAGEVNSANIVMKVKRMVMVDVDEVRDTLSKTTTMTYEQYGRWVK